MKRISLTGIADALERLEHRVEVEPELAGRARLAVERMLEMSR
jgi:quinolinate synthase